MAKVNFTPQFKRDYKKLKRKHYYDTNKWKHIINLLIEEKFEILAQKYDNHQLKGLFKSMRALHVEHNKAEKLGFSI